MVYLSIDIVSDSAGMSARSADIWRACISHLLELSGKFVAFLGHNIVIRFAWSREKKEI